MKKYFSPSLFLYPRRQICFEVCGVALPGFSVFGTQYGYEVRPIPFFPPLSWTFQPKIEWSKLAVGGIRRGSRSLICWPDMVQTHTQIPFPDF